MRAAWLAPSATAVLLATPALAQDFDPTDAATRAVARACEGNAGQAISRQRLDDAIRYETLSGLPGDDERTTDRRLRIAATKSVLLAELSTPGTSMAKAILVVPAPPLSGITTTDWLFTGNETFKLNCAAAKPSKPTEFAKLQPFAIRKTATDLAKLGDERETAGSAQLSFDDLRTTDLVGAEKRTRKFVVNAAFGITLIGNENRYAMAYGEYSRSRARIRTSAASSDPTKNGSADDVDAIELGLLGTSRVGAVVRATGRAGVIFDNVTDASYLAGTLSAVPITGGKPDLGICNLNSFRYIGIGIETRCSISLEGDFRHVLDKGHATIGASDMIVAAGPSLGIAFRRSLDLKTGKPRDGLTGSVTYKYLPVVTGTAPDLDRMDATLAYRWWTGDVGFDFGVTYADGIERKALADEHRIGFSFGVIF